jgi:hypothetical protein
VVPAAAVAAMTAARLIRVAMAADTIPARPAAVAATRVAAVASPRAIWMTKSRSESNKLNYCRFKIHIGLKLKGFGPILYIFEVGTCQ